MMKQKFVIIYCIVISLILNGCVSAKPHIESSVLYTDLTQPLSKQVYLSPSDINHHS